MDRFLPIVITPTCVRVFGYLGFVLLGVPLKWDAAFLEGETTVQSRDWETERGNFAVTAEMTAIPSGLEEREEKKERHVKDVFLHSMIWLGHQRYIMF